MNRFEEREIDEIDQDVCLHSLTIKLDGLHSLPPPSTVGNDKRLLDAVTVGLFDK